MLKQDKYLKDLLDVINQTEDKWDLERMRNAIIEARKIVEHRLYKSTQDEFREKMYNGYK